MNSPLPALGDLLAEVRKPAGGAKPSALPALGDLLAQATATQRDSKARDTAKRRLALGQGSAEERAADAARIRDWESKHEWQAVANVALFHVYDCECGKSSKIFEGLYRRETHRHLKHGAQRHVAVDSAMADLPNEVAIRTTDIEVCGACMDAKGWDLTNATEWGI